MGEQTEHAKKIQANLAKGLMPCGCEKKQCKCKLSAIEYVQLYGGGLLKGKGKELLKNKKKDIAKAAGKQIKAAWKFMKKS